MDSAQHILFIGASPSVASELARIKKSFRNTCITAPAARKHERGLSIAASEKALKDLVKILSVGSNTEDARLCVFSYESVNQNENKEFNRFWHPGAWTELLPLSLSNQPAATRIHIERRLRDIQICLHEISNHVYRRRRRSPLSLPIKNFDSDVSRKISDLNWYKNKDKASIVSFLQGLQRSFVGQWSAKGGHVDNRNLCYSPAKDEICHGLPHPVGSTDGCFLKGRFRFGVALYPGFHYDVTDNRSRTLACTLVDCNGEQRDLRSENRTYINVFPNDHLLPALRSA